MHELAIAQSILEQVQAIVEKDGLGRVSGIRLRVGALRAVVPEILTFGFEVTSQGTPLEGVQVEIDEVPIRITCGACGATTSPDPGVAWLCPECGSADVEMTEGKELVLESLEVEE